MKKQNKHQPPLSKQTFSINGIRFSIDIEGNIRSSRHGCLGHKEECIELAKVFFTLSEICEDISLAP